MKVIIDMPENDYKLACNYPDALIACYAHYIKEGTVLPNNHGRLIDADALKNHIENDGHTEAFAMAQTGREGKFFLGKFFLGKFFLMDNIIADIDEQTTVIEAEEGE